MDFIENFQNFRAQFGHKNPIENSTPLILLVIQNFLARFGHKHPIENSTPLILVGMCEGGRLAIIQSKLAL